MANVNPPAMALDICVHHWADGALKPNAGANKLTLTPNTIGINPSTVVIAVSSTGRRRKQPASKAA
ncbi:hypothetical protein HAALTHF_28910n [Vreelandella aquamarina]|nr:hypothetical protein HAALTHF_28910n [Halomonas axialensis]